MRCKSPAAIGDGVVLPVCLLLQQHCPQSILGCISLQQEWFSVVSKSQNGGCHTCLLQCLESLQGIFCRWHPLCLPAGPFPSGIFTEWLCNACEPFNEPPVVAYQTKKGTCLHVCLRQHTLCDCFHVWVGALHPIPWDSVCQICDFFSEKLHLDGFNFRLCSLNQSKMTHK